MGLSGLTPLHLNPDSSHQFQEPTLLSSYNLLFDAGPVVSFRDGSMASPMPWPPIMFSTSSGA